MMAATIPFTSSTSVNEMPDADTIKMFIGQIPKSWNENDVRIYFEQFGPIYMVNVLRDKVTKESRGCCFITYFTRKAALEAQYACHNIRKVPGMINPLQLKPADNENLAGRKIYVGMLSKEMTETDLREMFCRFGFIEECCILRDENGQSRGCGFVIFTFKLCAINAIKIMHQSIIFEGYSSPLVVKFADVRTKKIMLPTSTPGVFTLPTMISNFDNAKVLGMLQHHQMNCNAAPVLSQAPTFALEGLNPTSLFPLSTLATSITDPAALTFLNNVATASPNPSTRNCQLSLTVSGGSGNATTGLGGSSVPGSGTGSGSLYTRLGAGSDGFGWMGNGNRNRSLSVEGPNGANLFIRHLPFEFTDADLLQVFLPFGTIISLKVFIDKATNLSKCFGFVSYDNNYSAQMAIKAMNGFRIGTKRLKVQLKRSKDKLYRKLNSSNDSMKSTCEIVAKEV